MDKNTGWTKGDWVKQGSFIFSSEKPPRLIAEVVRSNMAFDEQQANSLLIAAAPNLYEALKRCILEMTLDEECDHDVGICWCSYKNARSTAQHAVAKAKGGQPANG